MDDNSAEVRNMLSKSNTGTPLPTARNFRLIMQHDNFFANVRLDTMRMAACRVLENGKRQYWEDADDALARIHIEEKYQIRNVGKTNDAFNAMLTERKFSPIQERIKSLVWDGKPHCQRLYIDWLRADDTAYTMEVTRIEFLQRIERAFQPGCKADQVTVLKGPQGAGKSTFIRWSALDDSFYASIATIDGQKGYEAVQGVFIAELEELIATVGVGTRKEDAVKTFISKQRDHYRRPYDRRASDNPRTCVFIGSTNRDKFLTDPTGNRRWYPIECRLTDGTFIFNHEDEVKAAIEQAYAEMFFAWCNHLPLASPVEDRALLGAIRQQQEASEMEDHRIGLIEDYLRKQGGRFTCCIDIWENVFQVGHVKRQMTRSDANEIGELLRLKIGCPPAGKQYFPPYGTQHCYSVPDSLLNE